MVKIRRFNEALTDIFEYDIRNITPKYLTIISGDITDINGMLIDPKDTLEIDLGPIHNAEEKDFHLNVEITLGNFIASGFNIKSPNIVEPYQYTSYHSKMDPSNTVFALTRESLEDLCRFFNHFDGIKVTPSDLKFLDSKDNFTDL